MKLRALAAIVALVTDFTFVGTLQAATLLIDDWNVSTGASISDYTVDPNLTDDKVDGEISDTRGIGGSSLPRSRMLTYLTAGDSVTTEDSLSGQEGRFVSGSSSSTGHGWWEWTPSSLDLSADSSIELKYSTDVRGADIIVSFVNFSRGIVGEARWRDLPNTGGALTSLSAPLPAGLSDVELIALDVFGVGGNYYNPGLGLRNYGATAVGLDMNVDDFMVSNVPVYWSEGGDAGGLNDPQTVASRAYSISGTIGGPDTVDVFKLGWLDGANFQVKFSDPTGDLDLLYLSLFRLDLTPILVDVKLFPDDWYSLGWLARGNYLLKLTTNAAIDPSFTLEFLGAGTGPAIGPPLPEPATLALFGLGLAGLGAVRRKKLAA